VSRLKVALLLTVPVLAGIVVGLWLNQRLGVPEQANPYATVGGDFTLQSADGPVSLHDFRGKVVLVYFGYTSCPDICPTSLTTMAGAMKLLTPEEREQVRGIFISVDPERDRPQGMKEYAAYFHPNFVGVVGTPAQTAEIAARYGVYYKKAPYDESAMGYGVDHSSTIYVVDRQGRVVDQIMHGATPEKVAASLRRALAGG